MFFRKVAFAVALVAMPVAAQAQTTIIDFNSPNTSGPYGGNGAAFTTTAENGYTATVTSGGYFQDLYEGPFAFSPAIATGAYNTTQNAVLTISGPGLFNLVSFDAFSDVLPSAFTVIGYLGTSSVYNLSGTAGTPITGATYTTFSGFNGIVDRVTLATNAPSRFVLDNVVVSAAADVPEPASWVMMVAGFGLIGGAMRHRQQSAISFT